MDGTILVADDDRTIRTVLTQALTRAGCRVHATSSLTTLLRWVSEGKGDVVISDVMMPDGNGLEMIPKIHELRADLPVIIISAQNTVMTAIQATEANAFDYLPKPFDLPDLMKRTARALAHGDRPRQSAEQITPSNADNLPLIGRTPIMQALYRVMAQVMNTGIATLIVGETGSGKSLIAKTLHDFSDRRVHPFVIATPSDFGNSDGPSRLWARARHGTLLFDEIANLNQADQLAIVRMMDNETENAPRFLATTQTNLTTLLEKGTLRRDLFYRIGGTVIDVPPLRDRIDDIALLNAFFLRGAIDPEETFGAPAEFDIQALENMRSYPWPGNVRQLENFVRRLTTLSRGEKITAADVDRLLQEQPEGAMPVGRGDGDRLGQSVGRHLQRYFDLHVDILPPSGLYGRILREIERPLIELSIKATGGNQAKCADLLGINRNTLRKKITDLDINVTRRRKLM